MRYTIYYIFRCKMSETILITEPSLGGQHKQHKGELIFKKY